MLPINSKKWRNILYLSGSAFALLLLLEIAPRYISAAEKLVDLYFKSRALEESRKNEILYKELALENKSLKEQIRSSVISHVEERSVAELLGTLEKQANAASVSIISLKPQSVVNKDHLMMQPVEITLHANYENLYNFVHFLENQEQVALVREIKMSALEMFNGEIEMTIKADVCLNL
ncbi:MAG: type 4a pilus biogenesis protein PilO [Ignavibacteriales bacterium]|nr:type 4a pilus biogenesis protein PilO [Ignavibacteriales bacterium]